MGTHTASQLVRWVLGALVCWVVGVVPPGLVRTRGSSSWEGNNRSSSVFPAYFIFGDSLVDVGNNNFIFSVARANSLPFGIDFPDGPTGRFTNGKTVTDILCEILSLPFPPPYLAPTTRDKAILKGVNYASGAGGIVRRSGINFVGRVDMGTQLDWYANNVQDLQQQLGHLQAFELLSQSLFSITIGSNDYINNYLLKGSPTSLQFTATQYQEYLLDQLSFQLMQLYNMGARKVLVTSLGPLGCVPSELAKRSVNGECSSFVNNLSIDFNANLKLLLLKLNSQLAQSDFIYADVFQPVLAYRTNPVKYGFKYGSNACCGAGRFKGQTLCLPFLKACPDRKAHVFFDAYHPSESTNILLGNTLKELL